MLSSISLRLVLALLAMSLATAVVCVPERVRAEGSQPAASAASRFLQAQRGRQNCQFAKTLDASALYELPLSLNETTCATLQPAAALRPLQLAATLLEAGTVCNALPLSGHAAFDGCSLLIETPEQTLAPLMRLVADDQRVQLLSAAAPGQR